MAWQTRDTVDLDNAACGLSTNRLVDGQARTAVAAALLRQPFVEVREHVAWDPSIASGSTDTGMTAIAA